ncbi:uncharacterized CRM domain-containing protein At3g25440, chloroplastic [Rhododendron vialii]|uniref:uncharacterized CRM domain-containing protein At3g25440, chloroplastic n=1 Tax=Rhododendron vialii TaxID=182163 RepID=UPI00265FC65B|nr:uncharacterized CRM domain-containing protein At3g25440, chloroplastic [Rhododendron vialii]
MANPWFRGLRRIPLSSLRNLSSSDPLTSRLIPIKPDPIPTHTTPSLPSKKWVLPRNFSHGSVHLVISEGKPKFETRETEPPTKEKWKTKKRFKQQRKRDKDKRKSANKRDPRFIGVKGKKKKQKFANAADRINDKLEKAKVKEAMLIERLKRYEVAKAQGPVVEPHDLTGEERFYFKKMAQKRSNYAPVGRRGIFGGVILNMHMHWKKHETVKVICKPCKPGQVQEYADEIARLSGGIPIQIIGDNTIIFYRGKNYVQPVVMSPIDTLSKKKALEKSKYEQSLESVRHFIAIAEKELELYYRHVALYGDPNNRGPNSIVDSPRKLAQGLKKVELEAETSHDSYSRSENSLAISEAKVDSTDEETSETEDEDPSVCEIDVNDDNLSGNDSEVCDGGEESSIKMLRTPSSFRSEMGS